MSDKPKYIKKSDYLIDFSYKIVCNKTGNESNFYLPGVTPSEGNSLYVKAIDGTQIEALGWTYLTQIIDPEFSVIYDIYEFEAVTMRIDIVNQEAQVYHTNSENIVFDGYIETSNDLLAMMRCLAYWILLKEN